MSNIKCDRWLKLGSTKYDVFFVETLKFEQYQFAQVLVTHESTQSGQFTCMRDSTHTHTRMLDGACECSYCARTRERTQARVRTCIKSVLYMNSHS